MTRRTSRRRLSIDWQRVAACFDAADTQESTNELGPGWHRGEFVEPRWAPEYLHALQAALEQRKFDELLALLDDRRLLHPQLLPIVAEIIRSLRQGSAGRPNALTAVEDAGIRTMFDLMVYGYEGDKDRRKNAIADIEERFGYSKSTIKRSLERTDSKPPDI